MAADTPSGPPRVGWICPAIDKAATGVRRLARATDGPTRNQARNAALEALEEVRDQNTQLRDRATWLEAQLDRLTRDLAPCHFCDAPAGEPCQTPKGIPRGPHVNRKQAT